MGLTTWYLISNLPAPSSDRATTSTLAAASLEEVVRLYGLRMWVEQSYKQVKGALGWAEESVRSDQAIRRHWTLVCCAFTFCWWHTSCVAVANASSALAGAPQLTTTQTTSTTVEREKSNAVTGR